MEPAPRGCRVNCSFEHAVQLLLRAGSVCTAHKHGGNKHTRPPCFGLKMSLSPSGLPSAAAGRGGGRSVQHRGLLHAEQQPSFLPGVHPEPQPVLEGRLRHQPVPGPRGEGPASDTYDTRHVCLI